MKKFISALLISFSLVFGLAACGQTTVTNQQTVQNRQNTVTFSLNNGPVTRTLKVPIKNNDTALAVLQTYAKETHTKLVDSGSGSMAYVIQIGNVKAGKHSGWMFSVNGKSPNVGAGVYKVKSKETIKWYYTKF